MGGMEMEMRDVRVVGGELDIKKKWRKATDQGSEGLTKKAEER